MRKKAFLFIAFLLAIAQWAWAWDGSGTSTDPYLIKTSADWRQLADDVNGGNSYSGKFFEMTADIDAEGVTVGQSGKPFSGTFDGNCSGGMVGYTSMPVTLKSCLVAPSYTIRINGGATFIRTPENMQCAMEKCYYTQSINLVQGEGVFDDIKLPEGSTYHVEPGTEVRSNGRTFWKSGSWVWLQAPFNQPFDHWACPNNNCHISNPWGSNGLHQINDVVGQPSLSVETTMPAAKMERTVEGTKYRYLSKRDYCR